MGLCTGPKVPCFSHFYIFNKIAVKTSSGHYEYLGMLFGQASVSGSGQQRPQGLHQFVYVDDILIFLHSLEKHRVQCAFQCGTVFSLGFIMGFILGFIMFYKDPGKL